MIRIIDAFQTDVLLVLEEAIELRMCSVETELREDESDICPDESTVPYDVG